MHLLLIPCYLAMLPYMLIATAITLPFYGIEKIRWSEGCIEIVAKRKPNGDTRIWGTPGAQTLAFFIAHASEAAWNRLPLRVHERRHVLQGALISIVNFTTFPFLWLAADRVYSALDGGLWWTLLAGFLWTFLFLIGISAWPIAYGIGALVSRIKYGTWYVDTTNDLTRETRGNIFECRAYQYDREFEQGLHPDAWGSDP